MSVTHIFFDLHGTLVDGERLHLCYSEGVGQFMAGRFGGTVMQWRDANRAVMADWHSYYADLNLSGDEGIADLYEGLYRTTRAMFRIAGVAEPTHETLKAISTQLHENAPRYCDAFFADAKPVIRGLYEAGYHLGVTSHALAKQAEATLSGGEMLSYFIAPIVGPDLAERFEKDETYFRWLMIHVGLEAGACLLVDDAARAIESAHNIGMKTAFIQRGETDRATPSYADWWLRDDLSDLLKDLV